MIPNISGIVNRKFAQTRALRRFLSFPGREKCHETDLRAAWFFGKIWRIEQCRTMRGKDMAMNLRKIAIAAAVAGASASAGAGMDVVPRPLKIAETDGTFSAQGPLADAVRYSDDATVPAEGYRLSVAKDGISVAASGAAGRRYALETLKQLAKDEGGTATVPCVEIEDAPRYPWRGVHLDECRHFFGKETVKKLLDLMVRYKLNRFHWHLTDDQGWRLDVPGYPDLVKYGAVRPQSVRRGEKAHAGDVEDADKFDGTPYGPYFYTEADLREIVAYAAERGIDVIPEIELPGHVFAALAAYPSFACHPENLAARSPRISYGIARDVLCIGNDDAVKFMEDVLDWVCGVFPFNVVHIGGDECPQVAWTTCPKCQARIEAENLGGVGGLQPWITRRFVAFLEKRGKRALGWDEYLLGDIPASAMGMSWRESRSGAGHDLVSGAAAAVRGHDVVMTPCSYCYLDYWQGLDSDTHTYIGRYNLSMARCYSFDPCAGVPEEARAHILGGQGNNWTEYTLGPDELEWKIWPRMMALAEVFWLGEAKPGFDDFKRRAAVQREWLLKAGVNCAPIED